MYTVDIAHQRKMEEAFFTQLQQRCCPAENHAARAMPMIVGIETEYLLVNEAGELISEALRNRILERLPHSSPELGSSTIETHTRPVPLLHDTWGMLQEMRHIELDAVRAARQQGCRLVRIGAYPGAFDDLAITQEPDRYQRLMDVSHEMHGHGAPPIRIGTITLPQKRCNIMSGCQAIHINIQVPAGERAIRMLNKAIEMVPPTTALGAHSPLMDCHPSGYNEFRVAMWEPLFTFPAIDVQYGVNTRRTGLPEYYYRGWLDYWRDVAYKLYMTSDTSTALDSNMKQFWRTVRLKPCPGKQHDCLLEIRSLSTQPSLEEDAAFYLLLAGLLHDAEWCDRPLLPLEYVKVNLDQASKYGLAAELYALDEEGAIVRRPAAAIAATLIEEAITIWQHTSPEAADLVALLRRRVEPEGESPARTSLRLYEDAIQAGHSRAAAAQRVLMNYVMYA
jgi:gamma-glutamyl:cysteine ligase YbdK (ATP-grasp superfamily)